MPYILVDRSTFWDGGVSRLAAAMLPRILTAWWAGCLVVGASACGSVTSSSTSPTRAAGAVTIAPVRGRPTTRFTVRFQAPDATAAVGRQQTLYSIAVTGAAGPPGGCVGARTMPAGAATKGAPVTVTLDPAKLGGAWCPGAHSARVVETAVPVCHPGLMCPQYVRVIRTVGTATFTVSNST